MNQGLTLLQFNHLRYSDKYALLEQYGTYLDVYRLKAPYKIALFALNGYYVEVWLNQVSDELHKAEAFDDYTRLDPFLSSIDVSGLYAMLR